MKRQRDPSSTRESLLNAATELFAQQGFAGTKVEQIARRARVNKAMISYHFGGKRKLYHAILSDSFAAATERLKLIRDSSGPADERLREFIGAFQEMVLRRPSFPAMMAREAISGGTQLDSRVTRHFFDIFGLVREIIEQGIREGSFRPVNPILAHVGLIGNLIFFFSTEPFRSRLLSGKEPRLEGISSRDFVQHTQEMIIRGLAADRS